MKALLPAWLQSRLRRNDSLRRAYAHYDLWRKFGTPWPDRVRMANSEHDLFIDPSEPRGQALARGSCRGQPVLKELWRRALRVIDPNLVLDVGANYGEFVFMPRYRRDALIIAVEPQPSLRTHLRRSHAAHPDAERIELVFSLAAEAPGEERTFYVDREWSGRSSAMMTRKMDQVSEVRVPVTSVDALVGDRLSPNTRVLFKVDVEGYEPAVLAGMANVLRAAEVAVGIVEVHRHNLEAAGRALDEYLAELGERFSLYAVSPKGEIAELAGDRLQKALEDPDYSSDLLLLSDRNLASKLTESVGERGR